VTPPIPLLILSDQVSNSTGLARVARDLALRIHQHLPQFRVGVLGVGGEVSYSCRFPFPNYSVRQLEVGMIPRDIVPVWQDFAGAEKGILLAIWNITWLGWLAQPQRLPDGHPVKDFLLQQPSPFAKWLYCPVDGHLPDGTLGVDIAPILSGFDRTLAYTRYGSEVIKQTLEIWGGKSELTIPSLPHGTDRTVFFPRDRRDSRHRFLSILSGGKTTVPLYDDSIILCTIATNSARKDWGLTFQTASALLRRNHNIFLWCHTNKLQDYWDLIAMTHQFGLSQRVVLTTEKLSDDDMAQCYSACDCMLGTGAGEGWGLPMSEALACNLPVIHGRYAGGAEFVRPAGCLIEPVGYHLEGRHMIQRPVFNPEDWADAVECVLIDPTWKEQAVLPEGLAWEECWPQWQRWLEEGILPQ
jgi:glycosyltransferase involved in cell wall biosynthesis